MESLEINNLFRSIYQGKRILITGNTGFKGSWLSHWLHRMGGNVFGYSLNIPTTPSHFELLNDPYPTVFGDILDTDKLTRSIAEIKPEIIFHLAAQSLVRESYANPILTFQTNCIGTLNVLQASNACASVRAFVNVTTDKVYAYKQTEDGYIEEDPLGGFDPYSASKACVEIITDSFRKSFITETGYLLASVRAGNVIGGGDWAKDRLIPDLVKSTVLKKETIIRYPDSTRPWQHVLEPLSGYLLLGQQLLEGKKKNCRPWNFGPLLSDCRTVREVLDLAKHTWNEIVWLQDTDVNPYESPALLLNSRRANSELSWNSIWDLPTAIHSTISWYRSYYSSNQVQTDKDLDAFISAAKAKKSIWCT